MNKQPIHYKKTLGQRNLTNLSTIKFSNALWKTYIEPSGKKGSVMKILSCRDVGVDYDFVARGKTEDEIFRQCAKHTKEAHGMDEIRKITVGKYVRSFVRKQLPNMEVSAKGER